jgi:hypothetical protein
MNHFNFQGTGTSPTTGVRYVAHGGFSLSLNVPASTLGFEQTQTVSFTLIGQGTVPNEVLTTVLHTTVDAKGNVTASVDDLRLKC